MKNTTYSIIIKGFETINNLISEDLVLNEFSGFSSKSEAKKFGEKELSSNPTHTSFSIIKL